MSFSTFKMRMGASGNNLREERIRQMRYILEKTFADDPSFYRDIKVFNKPSINCRIVDNNSATHRNLIYKIMSEYDHPVLKGDLVFFKDYWFICTHQQNFHSMYWNGVIEKTNHLLRWKDSDGNIVERYCKAEDSTKYTTGEEEFETRVILPDTRRRILLPYDPDTIKLVENTRLIIDKKVQHPSVYRISMVDRVTNTYEDQDSDINGIIVLTCVADQFNSITDNADEMIADYWKDVNEYTIDIMNASSPLYLNFGDTYQLDVKVTMNGSVQDVSKVMFSSSNESICTVSSTGLITSVSDGLCNISASIGTAIEILSVQVENSPVQDTYKISITDRDNDGEIFYGDTKTLFVSFYKNGIEYFGEIFDCELIGADGLAEINYHGSNMVEIKAVDSKSNIYKKFLLRVWNTINSTSSQIELKIVGFG